MFAFDVSVVTLGENDAKIFKISTRDISPPFVLIGREGGTERVLRTVRLSQEAAVHEQSL